MFIVIEGVDGVGKGVFTELLKQGLERQGITVTTTREPGGCRSAETLRDWLLQGSVTLGGDAELMMMMAARVEHVNNTINPALKAGHVVLCDRFLDSSYIYQVKLKRASSCLYMDLRHHIDSLVCVDLTLVLDTPVEAVRKRLVTRSRDAIEHRLLDWGLEKAMGTYRDLVKLYPRDHRLVEVPDDLSATQGVVDAWVDKIHRHINEKRKRH